MRIRPLLPILLSSVALPAFAADYSAICSTAEDSLGCIIEQVEFARQRNAESAASMARVDRVRARELALSLTHCKSRYARTPRCLAERANRFAAHQNQLIDASMARVAEVRAFRQARRAEAAASIAAVEALRTRQLELRQNRLIDASMAAAEIERQRRFAAHQNALATASLEAVAAERRRQTAYRLSPCASPSDTRPRCAAQRVRDFAVHQNALATASMQRVTAERERAFAAARNAEAAASIAAVERARASRIETATLAAPAAKIDAGEYAALTSHCVRQPDSPRCDAERIREFAAARNAEAAASIAAVERTRAAQRAAAYAAATSHCAKNASSPRCEAERARRMAAIVEQCRTAGYTSSGCNPALVDNPEIAYTLTHCKSGTDTSPRCIAEREHDFQTARNEEIDRSIAAVAAARARAELENSAAASGHAAITGTSPLETGAISIPTLPRMPEVRAIPDNLLRQDISADPCRTKSFEPLLFVRGSAIEESMKPELDRLANAAQTCPGMRIEVHGWADGGSPFNNRNLSQARAQAVADYLIANGVAPNRVAAMGRGGSRPALPYSQGYDHAFGGRAEFVIRDPSTDAAARRVMWDLAELLDPTYIPAVANLSP